MKAWACGRGRGVGALLVDNIIIHVIVPWDNALLGVLLLCEGDELSNKYDIRLYIFLSKPKSDISSFDWRIR